MTERRFASPTVLTPSTPFMGATAGEWYEALTGHGQFKKQLEVVKARVLKLEGRAKIDVSAAQMDLASSYRKIRATQSEIPEPPTTKDF